VRDWCFKTRVCTWRTWASSSRAGDGSAEVEREREKGGREKRERDSAREKERNLANLSVFVSRVLEEGGEKLRDK